MGRRRGAARLRLPICTECRAEVPARPLGEGLCLCRALMLLICNLQALCFSVFLPPPSPPLPWLFFLSFGFFVRPPPSLLFAFPILLCSYLPPPFLSALNPCVAEGESLGTKYILSYRQCTLNALFRVHWGRLYPLQVTQCYASSLFLISLRMPSLARSHGRSPSCSQEQFL